MYCGITGVSLYQRYSAGPSLLTIHVIHLVIGFLFFIRFYIPNAMQWTKVTSEAWQTIIFIIHLQQDKVVSRTISHFRSLPLPLRNSLWGSRYDGMKHDKYRSITGISAHQKYDVRLILPLRNCFLTIIDFFIRFQVHSGLEWNKIPMTELPPVMLLHIHTWF